VIGLVVGFAAVGLLAGPGGVSGRAIVLVLTSLAWSLGSLYSRHAALPRRPQVAVGMQMLAAGLVLIVFAAAKGEVGAVDVGAISLKSWLGLLYLILAGSLVAFTAYMWLLRNAPTSLVGTYAYVNPVVAVLLGTVFLGEPLGWRTVVGGGIIVGSVAMIVRAPKPKELPVPDPRPAAAPARAS
jgi:drug/metabolite transporter (DMT)-like permease